jgi:hypothetical protein
MFFGNMIPDSFLCIVNLFAKVAYKMEILTRLMTTHYMGVQFQFGHITDTTCGAIKSLCLFDVLFQDVGFQYVHCFESSVTSGTHMIWCSDGFVIYFHVTAIAAYT